MIREKTESYRLHREGERQYLTFPQLDDYEELRHLFTTRHGGVSQGPCATWNFGERHLDTDENILQNFELLGQVLGADTDQMVTSAQTHTTNIKVVTAADLGKGVVRERDYRDIDGLVTDERNLTIITGHADCNAIFFFDPVRQVIGLAHSGWRGTLAGIGTAMVSKMKTEYGCQLSDIITGIGPSLCQDCFEVDEDVAQAFFDADEAYRQFADRRGCKFHIDLKGIIHHDLLAAGLAEGNLSDMELCTKCNKEMFFSHRGHQGRRGLMVAAMMLV
ncbi:Laccase domain protein SAV1187 [uncultured Eubacterium sp.]|nr:Laccase domain protein SAV1187 [uncultured Eubacterium sp.]